VCCNVLPCVTMFKVNGRVCSVAVFVAVCCSVLQCVAMCYNVQSES